MPEVSVTVVPSLIVRVTGEAVLAVEEYTVPLTYDPSVLVTVVPSDKVIVTGLAEDAV